MTDPSPGRVDRARTRDEPSRPATEASQAEEQVRRTYETFRGLVENSPFGVYIVDAQFRLRLVSAGSQNVFRNVRPLIGRDFAEVLRCIWAEPFATEAIERFRHTLRTGEPYHGPDTTERRSDIDDIESYDWKIERIMMPDGQWGVVCHFYDLTERQQAEETLREAKLLAEQASEAKSRFLAVMSHELRTPLTGVIAYSDLLEAGTYGEVTPRQKEALARIKANSWHLVSIIDEVLSLSRAEAGKEEVRQEEVDATEITREVARILEAEAAARGLTLRCDDGQGPLLVRTDPGKMRQILLNLVGNAVKYTRQGGISVELDASCPGWLHIHVRDTGPGIAPADQERIFEPFTQVDASHSRAGSGTGLGLAICRRLARLLGGEVTLRSTPPEGSTFTLSLPRARD